jgi:methionyl-tRNA formyltransferase
MHNNVRGLSPYPSAWVKLNKSTYKLYKTAKAEALPPEATQRDSYAFTNKQLWLKATDGWLEVLEFQPQGKKRMAPQAFLLGNQI